MKTKNNCDLKSCYLCTHCQPAWIPAIQGNRKVFHLTKGELLFKEDEPVTGMYFVYDGLIKVHKQWGADKELILRFAQKGDIVGHRGIGAEGHYPISATALRPTSVCFVELDFFYDSLKVNPSLILDLLNFFAKELKTSEQRMRDIVHMPVKNRIAQALLFFREKFGLSETGALSIDLSRQDFASYIGTTYETTFRMLNELEQEGLIGLNKKDIAINDITALQNLSK
jgi:CRP-like cAMP-binding protein